jgi:DNA-binding HxlR family transcriptional regulator
MDETATMQPNVLDQNCESRLAVDRLANKWLILVVYALVDGPMRHGELLRTITGVSQKMLTQTLRSMERTVSSSGASSTTSRPTSSTR